MLELIKELSLLNGISGRENAVREFIINCVKGYADSVETDPLGNLIVFKRGKKPAAKKVMLDAHMDEVGMIVSSINSDGTLGFEKVGGIDGRVMFGRAVSVGDNNIDGVIGVKPVHLLSSGERLDVPDEMFIDIGAADREDAGKLVSPGDTVCFKSDFVEFGDGFIKGKALDDRAGCAMLIKLIQSELPCDLYFSFSSGEEVGLGAAGAAAYSIMPDYAVVVETTTAADIASVPEEKRVCALGDGAVISFMDRRTVYPKQLFNRTLELADKNGIKAQVKSAVAGGNNASVIHRTAGGISTIAVSLPCRYLHSPSCVLKKEDIDESFKLISLLAEELAND